jgi:4-amino-4-deoxy-L-arabinose transferase-like glycosyltransferase
MLGIVPVLCFAVFVVTYAAICGERGALTRWRSSFLSAAVTWGLTVTAITELLSPFRLITFDWLLTLWVGVFLLSTAICFTVSTREKLTDLFQFPHIPRLEFWCVAAVISIVSMVGLVAFAAPPNNADSMTYHMPRVMHWIQNQTVAHYPTNILRQLFRPPWSGFAIMQFQVLSDGDQWANLVQWFSMFGSVVGVSLIAKQLGADTRGQVLAAVIAVTIPMGILQASSTQNDYVTAFWLVCLVHYILRFKTQPRWANVVAVGASLALALLAKGTAYLYALPLLAWFALSALRSLRWRVWQPLLAVAAIVLMVNLGHHSRNFDLWGNPFVVDVDSPFVNKVFSVPVILSNVIRNMSLHIGTSSTRVNGWIYTGIRAIHVPLGISVSDPRTTANEDRRFYQRPFRTHEDSAGNPFHLALIIGGITFVLLSRKQPGAPDLAAYASCLVVAFLIFCTYLNWNPYHSRLHLPLFVLWSPLVAVVLLAGTTYKASFWIAAWLITASTLYLAGNENRPLIAVRPNSTVFSTSRVDQVFKQYSRVKDAYFTAVQWVETQKCPAVGLDLGEYGVEYPFWVLLQKTNRERIWIEHVNVRNISTAKFRSNSSPCAVISARWEGDEAISGGTTYTKAWSSGPVQVFIKREPSS